MQKIHKGDKLVCLALDTLRQRRFEKYTHHGLTPGKIYEANDDSQDELVSIAEDDIGFVNVAYPVDFFAVLRNEKDQPFDFQRKSFPLLYGTITAGIGIGNASVTLDIHLPGNHEEKESKESVSLTTEQTRKLAEYMLKLVADKYET